MNIIVCIKQVPDTTEVRIDHKKGTLIREGVPSIINPDDKNAIEMALQIKETRDDVHVTVLSMGPTQALVALREALAMGADRAILLSDREFGGSDTFSTATIIAEAIKKIGDYDLIICGRQAIDGDTAQVGPQIAEKLDIPQITYAKKLIDLTDNKIIVERALEDGYMEIEAPLPVLVTAIKELNAPRFPKMTRIYPAFSKEAPISIWSYQDVLVDKTQIGIQNSPTNVAKTFVPVKDFVGEKFEGTAQELANTFIIKLKEQKLL